MNKLSKILLIIVVLLLIALSIMTFEYFKMRNAAKENLKYYLETETELYQSEHPDATIDLDIENTLN